MIPLFTKDATKHDFHHTLGHRLFALHPCGLSFQFDHLWKHFPQMQNVLAAFLLCHSLSPKCPDSCDQVVLVCAACTESAANASTRAKPSLKSVKKKVTAFKSYRPVTPYNNRYLGQQRLWWWCIAWRHQANTWTNVEFSSVHESVHNNSFERCTNKIKSLIS